MYIYKFLEFKIININNVLRLVFFKVDIYNW